MHSESHCAFRLRYLDFYLWGAAKSAVYRDRPGKLNELKTEITVYIRNISQADLQKVFANKIKWVQAFRHLWTSLPTPCTGCGRKNTPIWEGHSFGWGARTVVGSASSNSSACAVFSIHHGVVGRTSSLYC